MPRFTTTCVAALTVLSVAGAASANMIQNGNFALPALGGGYTNVSPGSTDITDWIVDNTNTPNPGDPNGTIQLIGPGFSGNTGFGTYTGGTGAQIVQLTVNGNGTSPGGINQTITTVPGQTYTFSVDVGSRNGAGAAGTAYFGSTPLALTPTGEAFVTETLPAVLATSSSTVVDIVGSSTGETEPLVITNVVVTPTPEPASIGLLGLGALGLLARRRRIMAAPNRRAPLPEA